MSKKSKQSPVTLGLFCLSNYFFVEILKAKVKYITKVKYIIKSYVVSMKSLFFMVVWFFSPIILFFCFFLVLSNRLGLDIF